MAETVHGGGAERAFAGHEHRELARGIEKLHELGGMVGMVTTRDLGAATRAVLHWLDTVFQPHAAWENSDVYPIVDRVAGTPWATRLMRFEHCQIRAAAENLKSDLKVLPRGLSHHQLVEFRAHVFALEALLRAHMAREELFLLPLLDEGTPLSTAAPPPAK